VDSLAGGNGQAQRDAMISQLEESRWSDLSDGPMTRTHGRPALPAGRAQVGRVSRWLCYRLSFNEQ
jgi:hypothetical protein